MGTLRSIYLGLILLLLSQKAIQGQTAISTGKVGGIAVRIDDNQPIEKWRAYAQILEKHNVNFAFAVNLGLLEGNPAYIECLLELQAAGHSLQDHTPNHTTLSFTASNASDYIGRSGVDHVSSKTVYLKYVIDSTLMGTVSGSIDVHNGWAISKFPGGFQDFVKQDVFYTGIYIHELHTVFGISAVAANNTTDVDSLKLVSYWGEATGIPNMDNATYSIVTQYNSFITEEAQDLLAERTLELARNFGLTRPNTWTQPGGRWPVLSREQQKHFGDKYQYQSGTGLPDVSLKCFNEYNPKNDKQFGMQWGDFTLESQTFSQVKSTIADRIARHSVLIGGGHFISVIGGWDGYLSRVDSLFSWCNEKKILVRTQDEWANILYNVSQNPYVNVFPSLSTDLDENGVPDGFNGQAGYTDGTLDTTDGVKESGGYSYSMAGKGNICYANDLQGVEKGENDFFIWTKGSAGNSVGVYFLFPDGRHSQIRLKFPATTSEWTKYGVAQSINGNTSLNIPPDESIISIQVVCSDYSGGIVKVSGFELRKKITESLKIVSWPDTIVRVNDRYRYQPNVVSKWSNDTLRYHLIDGPPWLSIDQAGFLSGSTPSVAGKFSVRYFIGDQHGSVDTQSFVLNVKSRRLLTVNAHAISLGVIPYGSAKDTSISLQNLGLDTTSILQIRTSGPITATSSEARILPGHSVVLDIQLQPKSIGAITSTIYVLSNAENSPDSILVSAMSQLLVEDGQNDPGPHEFALYPNFPNPFNPWTMLKFSVPYNSKLRLDVFNVLGQTVKTLVADEEKPSGNYFVAWDGRDEHNNKVASGVYFYRLVASPTVGRAPYVATSKMMLLK